MPISNTCHSSGVTSFYFKWIPSGMKYRGIQLNPNLDEIILKYGTTPPEDKNEPGQMGKNKAYSMGKH